MIGLGRAVFQHIKYYAKKIPCNGTIHVLVLIRPVVSGAFLQKTIEGNEVEDYVTQFKKSLKRSLTLAF